MGPEMRILVVRPTKPAVRQSIPHAHWALEGYDVQPREAGGAEALERIADGAVDAIVLDVSMPAAGRLEGRAGCLRDAGGTARRSSCSPARGRD